MIPSRERRYYHSLDVVNVFMRAHSYFTDRNIVIVYDNDTYFFTEYQNLGGI